MEELAPPPRRHHRERRHRRKASDAAAAALAAGSFGDVFPRFAGTAPADYAEVFGGVAASCSIPYLDLPPPAAAAAPGGDGGEYGEIFARFDFGDFAAPYEDALAAPDEIGSPSGSSRSSIRKESVQWDAEPSILDKHYPDSGYDKNFGDEQFYPVSSPPSGEQKFSMSYNKSTRGRPDDFVEITTCMVEPSISYVVDSCNFSNDLDMDHVPEIDNTGTHANGINGKVSPPNAASSSMNNADSASVVDQLQHIPTRLPTTTATKPTCVPISENICEDETCDRRSSTHSVSSDDAPSPDYPFLRVSNISLPAAPIKVQPPPIPPSKLLNKRESKENGDSVVDPNSAAAAMKEAMEFAEARLKAAKELMERKGDSFKLRKRPAHHRSTKSTEIKGSKIPEEVHLFEEKLSMRRLAKEETQNKDLPLPDDNRHMTAVKSVHCDPDKNMVDDNRHMTAVKSVHCDPDKNMPDDNRHMTAVKSVHCDPDKNMIPSPGKPQEMPQIGSKLEESGKWTSDDEFYELISHDQRGRPNAAPSEGDNGMKNSCTKLDQTEKGKVGEFAGELKRVRKLWDTTAQRRETVSLVTDDTSYVEVEHQAPRSYVEVEHQASRPPEVPSCKEKATDGEPTDIPFKQCPGHDDDKRLEISSMNNTPEKVHADPEMPEKEKAGGFSGEPRRVRKLWDTTGLKRETANLLKDATSSVGVELEAPRSPEVPFLEESMAHQEPAGSYFKQCQGMESSLESHDEDERFEIPCMNNTPVMVQPDSEMSSSFLEDPISGGWHDSENHSDTSAEETPLVEKSKQDNNMDKIICNSAMGPILYEHPTINEIKETQVKIPDTEESIESHESCEKEKLFDSVNEANIQNESKHENEETYGTLIHEEEKNFGIANNADVHEDFQEGDLYQDAESSEKDASLNEDEESEVLNVSLGHGKLMEANAITGGSLEKDPYQLQEPQGLLGPRDFENRTEIADDIVSDGEEKEAKESLQESTEMTLVEEALNCASKEGKKSIESSIHSIPEVHSEVNARSDRNGSTLHSVSEVGSVDGSDYAAKMNAWSNSLQASFSEACTRMQHLFQNAGHSSTEKADKCTPVKDLLEEDFREADIETPTENCKPEGEKTEGKMEDRDSEDSISNVALKDQQCLRLDSDKIPQFAEDTSSDIVHKSRDENCGDQRTNEREDVKYTEEKADEGAHVRFDEEKEKEKEKELKIEKEKEDKERRIRELEEEKERELERAKDRLAVQRATREAHERAFAEARAKAERIALERITSARQRASAEAREKEEKANAEAAAEKASREARLKAERAAVERATAEARERAIEKAKAAADAKDRMERFRSSFKDSSKTTNQDNLQEMQFQKRASINRGRSMDSSIDVVEVESPLRHKAKSEREQRTAERAAKALAEKNMRDMVAQREQAERHRLAEFLDPEVKRWSNGKEGNLRALLSTLQYILGADSGWQSVPLTDLITAAGVKKAYRRATLCVHPDKVQQRGATIRQKYICEKVFDLLKEAWNKYNSEER